MGWISKLLGGEKAASPDVSAQADLWQMVEADLAHACKNDPGVTGHLVRYVMTGQGADSLDTVARRIDFAFGRSCARNHCQTPQPFAQGRRAFMLRRAGQDIDLTIRYLRVLHLAIHAGGYRGERSDLIQHQPLVRQMLDIAVTHSLVLDKDPSPPDLPPDGMNRATLKAIAAALGGDADDVLAVLILNCHMLICRNDTWPVVGQFGLATGIAADLAERPAAVRAVLETLPYLGNTLNWTLSHLKLREVPEYAGYLADRLAAPDKGLRKAVRTDFATLPADLRERLMIERLSHADPRMREEMAALLIGTQTPAAEAALKARLEVEKAGAVRRLIETHFAGRAMQQDAPLPDDDTGYTAIGGARIAIPPLRDFIPGTRPVFGDAERDELVALIHADNAKRRGVYEERLRAQAKWNTEPKMIDPAHADHLIARLNGTKLAPALPHSSEFWRLLSEAGAAWYRRQLRRLPQETGLREGDPDALAWLAPRGVNSTALADYLQAPNLDLRQIDRLVTEVRSHNPKGTVLAKLIGSKGDYWREDRSQEFPPEAVWPLIAENLALLDKAFVATGNLLRKSAIVWIGLLPATPQRFMAPLLEIATSPKRESRAEARRLLAEAPGLDAHLIGLLSDSKADTRRVAAEWVGERRAAMAEGALRDRLKKEKTEAVRAAMITALDRIGADIAAYAGPQALLSEAVAGMAGVTGAVPGWLGLDTLGALRWRDGATIPEVVLHWWVRLAIRLKQPGGNGMLTLYVRQMHPDDAAAMGRLILDAWIAETLRTVVKQTPWGQDITALENDGAETKGILALAQAVPSTHAAARVRWYLKTHGQLSNQAAALLELLAAKGDPQSLQVVLAAANRQKQKSLQKLAGELVSRIAEDNDWTLDQLADRSVPTLGLDDTGRLDLPCGEEARVYVARLDEGLELALFNPEGKPVKALPKAEDDATVESNAAFSEAKKALTQARQMQGDRLFDAMCTGRVWPAGEWLADIHGHPLMRKIAERLVWQGLDAEGNATGTFRPTPEGDFIAANDAPADPAAMAAIRLAHTMLVDGAEDAAWTAHLADHEVIPLFAQFGRNPPGTVAAGAEGVGDRHGWVTDTFTLRGLAKKLGYDRGAPGDSGHFDHYLRRFPAAGLVATLNFSGNCLPEENLAAVIHDLRFARDRDGKPGAAVPPAKVPPVLLVECWHDYHAAASKAAFDPDWEKRSPW